MQIIWDDTDDAAGYETMVWDNVFNSRHPQRRPRAVVKASHENDVLAAVDLATQHNLSVSIRSGGHSFEVWSVQDNAMLVDLGDFKQVDVNPADHTVRATSSVTSKELNDLLSTHGLFFPGGHCPDVGLGGFLLQGGMGWNCANWGWGCEFVEGIDIVTAQGELIYCDVKQNSDLFWAARGAGPAFPGIVIRFHLRAVPCPRVVCSSGYIFPQSLYRSAFQWALSLVEGLDSDTEVTAKAHYQGAEICFSIFFITFKDSLADATRALQPIQSSRPIGTLSDWFCTPLSLDDLYEPQARANPRGNRYFTDNGFLGNDVDVVSVLAEPFLSLPHRRSFAFWSTMRPWSRRPLVDMALSLQSDHYFAIYTVWETEADDQRCQSWLRQVMKPTKNSCIGAYLGDSEFSNRLTCYWTGKNTKQLMQICQKWDPEGRIAGGYPRARCCCIAEAPKHTGD
ncbi:unnamed protein product [Penicillium salamii]|nr:unnamed protein product [Penicillium salamii]CAG8402407.1 unnamed protein product [Penicillium salamii]